MKYRNQLLIVFSNYNGMRCTNDLTEPRIAITIDSFRKQVPYWRDLHILLLDNNSNDGSEKLLKAYAEDSPSWTYFRKTWEDYYYGTLIRLIREYRGKYEHMMILDNDQFFFRNSFVDAALELMIEHKDKNIVAVKLNDQTQIDRRDRRKKNTIDGLYDEYIDIGKERFFLAGTFHKPATYDGFEIRGNTCYIPGFNHKRMSWFYFPPSNIMIKTSKFYKLRKVKHIQPPFRRNNERGSRFALAVKRLGRTASLVPGVSINVGPRGSLSKSFKIKPLMAAYERGEYEPVNYFFIHRRKLYPLDTFLSNEQAIRNA